MTERIARRVVVHGRVQGVFFRECTSQEAARHGVAGWVANRPDGTVEAHFEGDRAAVRALVRWSRVGPRHAAISHVDVSEVAPSGMAGFSVR